MDTITIDAQARGTRKKALKSVRRAQNVPCVLYGPTTEPVVFQTTEASLKPLIFTQETHRVQIKLDDQAWECIVKDIAYHPVTDRPIHVDFQVLTAGEKLTLTVPVRYHGTPVGQVNEGGDTQILLHELTVTCLPQDIPSQIDVEIGDLSIGDSIHASDLDVPDVKFEINPGTTLVTVLAPRVVAEEVEEEEVPGLPGEEEEEQEEEGEE